MNPTTEQSSIIDWSVRSTGFSRKSLSLLPARVNRVGQSSLQSFQASGSKRLRSPSEFIGNKDGAPAKECRIYKTDRGPSLKEFPEDQGLLEKIYYKLKSKSEWNRGRGIAGVCDVFNSELEKLKTGRKYTYAKVSGHIKEMNKPTSAVNEGDRIYEKEERSSFKEFPEDQRLLEEIYEKEKKDLASGNLTAEHILPIFNATLALLGKEHSYQCNDIDSYVCGRNSENLCAESQVCNQRFEEIFGRKSR